MQNTALIEKIRGLPPEVVNEVEDFVDFLTEKKALSFDVEATPLRENLKLQDIGITKKEAFEQRLALTSFAEDWELPEMEIYDEL